MKYLLPLFFFSQLSWSSERIQTRLDSHLFHPFAVNLFKATNTAIAQEMDLDAKDGNGQTLLHRVANFTQNPKLSYMLTKTLLKAGVNIYVKDENEQTPVDIALKASNLQFIIAIVEMDLLDPEARDKFGNTLLHKAARYTKEPAIIEVLVVEAGFDPDARNKSGDTPSHEAAKYNNNSAIIRALAKTGADQDARNKSGDTPLFSAAQHTKTPAVIKALIETGANGKIENNGRIFLDPEVWKKNKSSKVTRLLKSRRFVSNCMATFSHLH